MGGERKVIVKITDDANQRPIHMLAGVALGHTDNRILLQSPQFLYDFPGNFRKLFFLGMFSIVFDYRFLIFPLMLKTFIS